MTRDELVEAFMHEETPIYDFWGLYCIFREATANVLENDVIPKMKEYAASKDLKIADKWFKEPFNGPTLVIFGLIKPTWKNVMVFFEVKISRWQEIEDDEVSNLVVGRQIEYAVKLQNSQKTVSEETKTAICRVLQPLISTDEQQGELTLWQAVEDESPRICVENIEKVVTYFQEKTDLIMSALEGIEGL